MFKRKRRLKTSRFCTTCGSMIIWVNTFMKYDRLTGKGTRFGWSQCPRYRWWKLNDCPKSGHVQFAYLSQIKKSMRVVN